MVFVREVIPVRFLSTKDKLIKALYFEISFHKKKWVVCCSYNPNKNIISRYLEAFIKSLVLYSAHYENNKVSVDDLYMKSFCESYRSKSSVRPVLKI